MSDCCAIPSKPSRLRAEIALYRPLIVMAATALAVGAALHLAGRVPFMEASMGLFLILIAVLKLFDVAAFAALFTRYDLVARRVPGYARLYPFIELGLGVLFLTGAVPVATNMAALIVMGIGVVSVAQVIRSGQIVNCACIGAGFSLPVGRVTLFEYGVMAAMAAANLWGM